jgi:NAD(P)H-dependent flavin oxidoreductase YrpB (nitropropane dioxygenase family)
MLTTRATRLLGVTHPVVLGGMGGATDARLVAAVSNAGGLGILGTVGKSPDDITRLADEIRERTEQPFGLNVLPFRANDAQLAAVLAAKPPIFSSAWAAAEQDLSELFARAHAGGSRVIHMVASLADAQRGAEAGADVLVAQGSEGGGHVGLISTMVLVPQVARAVAPIPVIAAGGLADGAGLAAALMLGADGVLLGTRFLATPEAPVPDSFKRAIVASDGHDTLLTEIPDVIAGNVWPGAYARVIRNQLIATWAGRDGELRARRAEINAGANAARQRDDAQGSVLYAGQVSGLIDSLEPAGDLVERIVRDAEALLRGRATELLAGE